MASRMTLSGLICMCLLVSSCQLQPHNIVTEPYALNTGLISRSICFENPTGAPGQGGQAASNLGPTRKGKPSIDFKAGQTVQLCDIEGSGTIRLICTTGAV